MFAAHFPQGRDEPEAGFLALVEPVNGFADLAGSEPQTVHDRPRGADLVLAYPAVDLREVAHAAEQGTMEAIAQGADPAALLTEVAIARLETTIELVAEEEAQDREHGLQRCQPDERPYDLAPIHALTVGFPIRHCRDRNG